MPEYFNEPFYKLVLFEFHKKTYKIKVLYTLRGDKNK